MGEDRTEAASAWDLRDFRDEFRAELRELRITITALEKGQSEIRIEFERNRANSAEKDARIEVATIKMQADEAGRLAVSAAKQNERTSKLDAKVALLWGGWLSAMALLAQWLFEHVFKHS